MDNRELAVRKIAGNLFEQLTGILRLRDSLFFSIFFLTRTSNLKAIIFGSYFPCLLNVVLLCKTRSNLLAIFRAIYEILRSNLSLSRTSPLPGQGRQVSDLQSAHLCSQEAGGGRATAQGAPVYPSSSDHIW